MQENGTNKNGLPEGWQMVKLEDVFDVQGGSQPPKTNFVYDPMEGYVQLLQIRDFGEKGVPTYVPKKLVTKFCKKDDILIARYGASLGRIVTGLEGAYNVALAKVIDVKHLFEKRYIFYLLKTQIFQQPLMMLSRSAQNGFSKSEIADIELPLPPLTEQQLILSKVEELFSELDKSVEGLKTAQQQLKAYRQSVLQWAFEGKLGLNHDSDDLPDAQDFVYNAGNNHANQINQENQGLDNLPEGWKWVKLKDIALAIDPQPSHRTPPVADNGIPYVSTKDFDYEKNEIDFSKARRVSPRVLEEHIDRYTLKEGDFVIGKIGTIGKPVHVVLPQNYTLSANIVLIQPRKIYHKFLYYFFRSEKIEKEFQAGSKATTQAAFGIQKVRELPIALPTFDEQQKIVQEIEARLSVADKLEETLSQSLQQAEALRQSILKRAFEGRLNFES